MFQPCQHKRPDGPGTYHDDTLTVVHPRAARGMDADSERLRKPCVLKGQSSWHPPQRLRRHSHKLRHATVDVETQRHVLST
ncbi:hypothetical protein [Mycobacteroides immunogenum]|uniref:hypothetical protein n=1 Tax=Mycobacteroides immunogenum TaxID=83262 RepID=UPI001F18F12E|nr:hypothetical protein [Mycobacteroides immunogenum]